jgi:hypothetical protein
VDVSFQVVENCQIFCGVGRRDLVVVVCLRGGYISSLTISSEGRIDISHQCCWDLDSEIWKYNISIKWHFPKSQILDGISLHFIIDHLIMG